MRRREYYAETASVTVFVAAVMESILWLLRTLFKPNLSLYTGCTIEGFTHSNIFCANGDEQIFFIFS